MDAEVEEDGTETADEEEDMVQRRIGSGDEERKRSWFAQVEVERSRSREHARSRELPSAESTPLRAATTPTSTVDFMPAYAYPESNASLMSVRRLTR